MAILQYLQLLGILANDLLKQLVLNITLANDFSGVFHRSAKHTKCRSISVMDEMVS